jgi:hypothetical protein
MSRPVFYPTHFLEGSTVTVPGAAVGFEANNLSDRNVQSLWMDTAFAGSRSILAHWTSSDPVPAVDTWIIPAGHGLVGVGLSLQSSPDNVTFTPRDTVTPSTTAAINRSLVGGPYTFPWWALVMTGATAASYLSELYLTQGIPVPLSPLLNGMDGLVSDVTRIVTPGGFVRLARNWGPRWHASWTLPMWTASQWATALTSVFPIIDAKPFYLTDVDGILRWVTLVAPTWLGTGVIPTVRDLQLVLEAAA